MITQDDANALAAIGGGNNVPGHVFTRDGNPPRLPSASDHFPDVQSNVLPIMLSMGAYNCLQQSDCHSYWEFNQYTDWVFPLDRQPREVHVQHLEREEDCQREDGVVEEPEDRELQPGLEMQPGKNPAPEGSTTRSSTRRPARSR